AWNKLAVAVKYAFDIGEQKQTRGLHCARHRARDRIRVDVVGLPFPSDSNWCDHRNEIGIDDCAQHFRIDPVGLAHNSEIDHFHLERFRIEFQPFELARDDEIAVLAGKTDGAPSGSIDAAADL